MDANSDGSVTYHFGEEAQADTGLAVAEPLQAHAPSSSNGSSNGSSGALSHAAPPTAGEAGPHHVPLPAAAHLGEPLQEALHLGAGSGSSSSSGNGSSSSRNGSAASSSGRGGAAATSGSALGAIAGDALQQPSDIPNAAAGGKEGKAAGAKLDPLTADYSKAPAGSLLGMYNACCRANDLDTALLILKQSIRAGRADVLKRWAGQGGGSGAAVVASAPSPCQALLLAAGR